ncbi:TBPIP domain-containing protein, putative [Eimeria mitis]|uniref:TBPIP domain-containing protein, putative n=1 Tax=Eimeria mitis TaxID=44415 RepID=U6KDG5_9EIME|nr:TBPIP domain-containing protein, putative [Eimeria mitis]CDJ36060.1 TBPIP domain-containing protein, putative [Eimeria mitis]
MTSELLPVTKGCKRAATQKQPRRKKPAKAETAADGSTNNEEPAPREVVLAYMRQQNRPYNLQLIFDNLRRCIKKPDLERLLDQLVDDGCLISKDLGKTRVFMYSQSQFGVSVAENGDIAAEIKQFVKKQTALQQRMQEIRNRGALLDSLTAKVAAAEAERAAKEEKRAAGNAAATVTAAEASAAEHLHAKLHAAWALQKRRCLQLVTLLSERAQADPQQLQEELGLERDEDFIPPEAYSKYD